VEIYKEEDDPTEYLFSTEFESSRTNEKAVHNSGPDLLRREVKFPVPGVPSTFLPMESRIEQHNAHLDLKAICQPQGVSLDQIKNYVYRVRQPYSTRIYIIDSGCNKSSEVCKISSPYSF
jgi:hypothetical protein